jgi:deoxyribodipyrimidine photo-lyase
MLMKPYRHALFVFNRDLRIIDNRALSASLQQAKQVTCAFVVDPVFNSSPDKKRYAKQFLLGALIDLDDSLHELESYLILLTGSYVDVLINYIKSNNIDSVFVNCEYAHYGVTRFNLLKHALNKVGVALYAFHDSLLFPPGFILKDDGEPYKMFTPFYRRAKTYLVESVVNTKSYSNLTRRSSGMHGLDAAKLAEYWQIDMPYYSISDKRISFVNGLSSLGNYENLRDVPALESTSKLSVHLKFGTLSIRQAYWAIHDQLGGDSPILRQLYWRDFFTHIGFLFPHVFQQEFNVRFSHIAWENSLEKFTAWCNGETGFPIVDAGMRELNQTGFMHNRVRMIVASFLVKDLHIDWRWGERYFADKLIDYDPAVNNGNWQWAASTGCDAQPYFRIFNPWLQQKKFDAKCEYIYRWVPELCNKPIKTIHQWYLQIQTKDYPLPIVDHALRSKQAKVLFAQAVERNKPLEHVI